MSSELFISFLNFDLGSSSLYYDFDCAFSSLSPNLTPFFLQCFGLVLESTVPELSLCVLFCQYESNFQFHVSFFPKKIVKNAA